MTDPDFSPDALSDYEYGDPLTFEQLKLVLNSIKARMEQDDCDLESALVRIVVENTSNLLKCIEQLQEDKELDRLARQQLNDRIKQLEDQLATQSSENPP